METISLFFQLSGISVVNVVIFHWFYPLERYEIESLAPFITSDLIKVQCLQNSLGSPSMHTDKNAHPLHFFTGSTPMTRPCPAGCVTCSALNGCLSCKPRLFFHLELDGMRQRGTCLSSCPRGHYGMRSPHISTCTSRYQWTYAGSGEPIFNLILSNFLDETRGFTGFFCCYFYCFIVLSWTTTHCVTVYVGVERIK